MCPSHSQQKEELILRIAASRVHLLDESLKVSQGISSMPSKLRDACPILRKKGRDAAAPVVSYVTDEVSDLLASSDGCEGDSCCSRKKTLVITGVVGSAAGFLLWRYARRALFSVVKKLIASALRGLRDVVTKVLFPTLFTAIKGVFKTVFSLGKH